MLMPSSVRDAPPIFPMIIPRGIPREYPELREFFRYKITVSLAFSGIYGTQRLYFESDIQKVYVYMHFRCVLSRLDTLDAASLTRNLSLRTLHFVHARTPMEYRKILNGYRGESKMLMSRPVQKNVWASLKANDLERNIVRCSESTYENISRYRPSSLGGIASNVLSINQCQRSKSF